MTGWTRSELEFLATYPFLRTARPSQKPPRAMNWRNWLFLGGRGAGKTRAGAEWLRYAVNNARARSVALIGPTLSDVREVMIEGPSGLRQLGDTPEFHPDYCTSRRRLEWPNGAVGYVFSAEDPDSLRGPQFDAVWCDELAAWREGEAVWDTMQMALRRGLQPQCVATTTPRPVPLIKRLVGGEAVVTRAATSENATHLSAGFIDQMRATYGEGPLARQELLGELVEDPEGALWSRVMIEASRVASPPEQFEDIVVAVDPPATSQLNADACGIVAAGVAEAAGYDRRCFILSDASERGLRPMDWGMRVAATVRAVGASTVIAEANQGGEMVASVLASAGCEVPIRLVRAHLGKRARAMPVAALYARGQVAHVGVLRPLEDEMCRFGAEGFAGSPDRVDALVWAVTTLMLERSGAPRIRQL